MYVKGTDVKERRKENQESTADQKKTETYEWSLPDANMSKITVCKGLYLTTLGFSPNTAESVINAVQKVDVCSGEGTSGGHRHTPSNKNDTDAIKRHINKCHHIKHHYRYQHAPNRFYLPADITIKMMHNDFLQNPENKGCSYETFRKVMQDMNIGFTTLSGDECSRCSQHIQHTAEHGINSKEPNFHEEGCHRCQQHENHITEAKTVRDAYRADADNPWEDGTVYFSADMMRVFMLPQLPLKETIFTQRLTCFNETFALLMPSQRDARKKKTKSECSSSVRASCGMMD